MQNRSVLAKLQATERSLTMDNAGGCKRNQRSQSGNNVKCCVKARVEHREVGQCQFLTLLLFLSGLP